MGKFKKVHALRIGIPKGKALKIALRIMHEKYPTESREFKSELLTNVYNQPANFISHEHLAPLAKVLLGEDGRAAFETPLKQESLFYKIYGPEGVDQGSIDQMNVAARLPISVAAALMPDAHVGYGLPIGGVLATENAVIPYGVGVDIGCRMCISVYNLSDKFLKRNHYQLQQYLMENTVFGAGKGFDKPMDDEVLDRPIFNELTILKGLKDKAWRQIGSSGGGNHFVEFGLVEITDPTNEFNVPLGTYLAVLSHSGSRGLGANIATHYTKVARKTTLLPKEAQHLAWLSLDSEQGQEYWEAMNLAGDYASACHHQIHKRMAKSLGEEPLFIVENHHNFAWKEQLADGRDVIVHRKGATPAGKGVLGIIPGSMTTPGFIVRGKGNPYSINSASHGAGRVLSRRKAKQSITRHALNKIVKQSGVTLIGGGVDESPMVYKDIHKVMNYQTSLVDVIGKFHPKIVRMDYQ